MKSKKQNLSKLALSALLAVASSTTIVEATEMFDTQPGVLLAGKCGAAKCGAFSFREEVADNSSDMNNPYNPKYNTYSMEKGGKPKESAQKHPEESKETEEAKGRYYYFSDQETNPAIPKNGDPSIQRDNFTTSTTFNRQHNSDYDYHRAAVTTVTSSQTLNEAQLLGMLNPQGRAMYLSLDPEAKALAIQLASEDSYKDKNLAIKEVQRRMNDRLDTMKR